MRADAGSTGWVVGKPSGSGVLLGGAEIVRSFPHASLDASLWRYYAAATSTDPVDVSAIEHDPSTGTPTAALVASDGPDGVAYFGKAATFEIAGDLTPRGSLRVGREIAEALLGSSRNADRGLAVRIVGHGTELTGFERVLLASGASASLDYWAETNLALPEEQLWTSLRKSYRSLINVGQRELSIEVVDEATPDRERFEEFRTLHREVAGRVTRPSESWDIMHELLTEGRAQLVLARLGGRTVAGTFLMRFGNIAVYASGAYVRDLGKFPVSHWPLYASMHAAKRSGVERLVLGQAFLEDDSHATPKERSIGAFKTGFASEIRAYRTYRTPHPNHGTGAQSPAADAAE